MKPEVTTHAQGFVLSRIGIEMLNSQPLSKVWRETELLGLIGRGNVGTINQKSLQEGIHAS